MRPMLILVLSLMVFPAYAQQAAGFYTSVSATGTTILTNVRSGPGFSPVKLAEPTPVTRPSGSSQPQPQAYTALVSEAANLHDVPEALLHAVIQVESGYNALALSPRGAVGLMQLMPATAVEMGVADIWDPASNISGGARYLKSLMTLFEGDIELALAAYNAGPGAVQQHGRTVPPFAETQKYVPRVLRHYQHLQAAHRAK